MNVIRSSRLQGKRARLIPQSWMWSLLVALPWTSAAVPLHSQICQATADMDVATRSVLESASQRYFYMLSKGDVFSLKQSSIASLAANFSGIETAVVENKPNFAGALATPRPPFFLQAKGPDRLSRAEFLCGVFGANGQTRDSAVFVIPNLDPGNYGVVIMDANGQKGPYVVSFVMQQVGTDWKIGGLFVKAAEAAGHDAIWFMDHARQYKSKGQTHNAWLYLHQARDLLAPVPFMSTLQTDKLYDEMQEVKPADLPADGNTVDLPAAGKTFKLSQVFGLGVGRDLDLVVKYQVPDVSDTTQTFQDNMAVIKALVTKFPEFRDAFAGVVARAVEPSGKDYGSLLAMKDIK